MRGPCPRARKGLAGHDDAEVPEAVWLTPDQQARLLAVTSAVTGAVRLLAEDPGTAILHGLLARLCAVLDHAAA